MILAVSVGWQIFLGSLLGVAVVVILAMVWYGFVYVRADARAKVDEVAEVEEIRDRGMEI